MIYLKTKAVGLDIPIQSMQNFLYVQLKKKWGLVDNDIKAYGRIYRNQSTQGYIPEAYMGNGEYADTFFDDLVKMNYCFFAGEHQTYNKGLSVPVSIIFCVNVPQVKPGYAWRADEEIRLDVENLLHSPRNGFMFTGVETGIGNVFKEFTSWNNKRGIPFTDTHPFHCFRINLLADYSVSLC